MPDRIGDSDIRAALHSKVLAEHHQDKNTVVMDEFNVCCGDARVDVAVVNDLLHGFEIKSDLDTLDRLEHQQKTYSTTFDRLTLVVGPAHLEKASALLPEWWGIQLVEPDLTFTEVRPAQENPSPDPASIAVLLWKDELILELHRINKLKGFKSKRRHQLAERLASQMDLGTLRAGVTGLLRRRARNGQGRFITQEKS